MAYSDKNLRFDERGGAGEFSYRITNRCIDNLQWIVKKNDAPQSDPVPKIDSDQCDNITYSVKDGIIHVECEGTEEEVNTKLELTPIIGGIPCNKVTIIQQYTPIFCNCGNLETFNLNVEIPRRGARTEYVVGTYSITGDCDASQVKIEVYDSQEMTGTDLGYLKLADNNEIRLAKDVPAYVGEEDYNIFYVKVFYGTQHCNDYELIQEGVLDCQCETVLLWSLKYLRRSFLKEGNLNDESQNGLSGDTGSTIPEMGVNGNRNGNPRDYDGEIIASAYTPCGEVICQTGCTMLSNDTIKTYRPINNRFYPDGIKEFYFLAHVKGTKDTPIRCALRFSFVKRGETTQACSKDFEIYQDGENYCRCSKIKGEDEDFIQPLNAEWPSPIYVHYDQEEKKFYDCRWEVENGDYGYDSYCSTYKLCKIGSKVNGQLGRCYGFRLKSATCDTCGEWDFPGISIVSSGQDNSEIYFELSIHSNYSFTERNITATYELVSDIDVDNRGDVCRTYTIKVQQNGIPNVPCNEEEVTFYEYTNSLYEITETTVIDGVTYLVFNMDGDSHLGERIYFRGTYDCYTDSNDEISRYTATVNVNWLEYKTIDKRCYDYHFFMAGKTGYVELGADRNNTGAPRDGILTLIYNGPDGCTKSFKIVIHQDKYEGGGGTTITCNCDAITLCHCHHTCDTPDYYGAGPKAGTYIMADVGLSYNVEDGCHIQSITNISYDVDWVTATNKEEVSEDYYDIFATVKENKTGEERTGTCTFDVTIKDKNGTTAKCTQEITLCQSPYAECDCYGYNNYQYYNFGSSLNYIQYKCDGTPLYEYFPESNEILGRVYFNDKTSGGCYSLMVDSEQDIFFYNPPTYDGPYYDAEREETYFNIKGKFKPNNETQRQNAVIRVRLIADNDTDHPCETDFMYLQICGKSTEENPNECNCPTS